MCFQRTLCNCCISGFKRSKTFQIFIFGKGWEDDKKLFGNQIKATGFKTFYVYFETTYWSNRVLSTDGSYGVYNRRWSSFHAPGKIFVSRELKIIVWKSPLHIFLHTIVEACSKIIKQIFYMPISSMNSVTLSGVAGTELKNIRGCCFGAASFASFADFEMLFRL